MKIMIEVKNNYGRPVAYPVCVAAHNFAAIAKTETLTPDTLKLIGLLGYEVEVVQPDLSDLLGV